MSAPTPEAWGYFERNLSDIRDCVLSYGNVAKMEIPNTRLIDENDSVVIIGSGDTRRDRTCGEEQRGSRPLPLRYTIEDFDAAVKARDTGKLCAIMNDAWLRAPEDRAVYGVPGFTEMCNLLDCTVDGFFPEEESDDCGMCDRCPDADACQREQSCIRDLVSSR